MFELKIYVLLLDGGVSQVHEFALGVPPVILLFARVLEVEKGRGLLQITPELLRVAGGVVQSEFL